MSYMRDLRYDLEKLKTRMEDLNNAYALAIQNNDWSNGEQCLHQIAILSVKMEAKKQSLHRITGVSNKGSGIVEQAYTKPSFNQFK